MKYYCIGIKGAGMATLASLLSDLGNEVSGYDDIKDYKFTQANLDERGIKIFYDQNHDIDQDTIVTWSKAFREDHAEIQRVKALNLHYEPYHHILGALVDNFITVGVSGTHGKTTTSSLITQILNRSIGTNYFIGDGSGYGNCDNKYFVIESDEFNRHFLAYKPTYAVITNIEEEHLDIYKDLDDIVATFNQFANGVKEGLVVCGDNANIRKLKFIKPVLYYGLEDGNDITARYINYTQDGITFDCYIKGVYLDSFKLPLYGDHMLLNVLAAIGIAYLLKLDIKDIKEGLMAFKNAKRRFQIEKVDKTIIIDDYAHHPTEIISTINSTKQKYPNHRIVAVFKPNTYSRTSDFTDEFINALNMVDKCYLTKVESNREQASDYPGVDSHLILAGLKNGEMISDEKLGSLLSEKGSVILIMSCASVTHLKENLINSLKKMQS